MPSVLFIKIVIMSNSKICDNHITMIDYNYITIYSFYLNIINFFKYIYTHQYIVISFIKLRNKI